MAYIGVDLHTNSFTVCRLGDDGAEVFETFNLSASDLSRFCFSLDAGDEIAVEATGNTAWFGDEGRCCIGRVVVVNPRQFQVICKSVKNTDKNDAAEQDPWDVCAPGPQAEERRPGKQKTSARAGSSVPLPPLKKWNWEKKELGKSGAGRPAPAGPQSY